MNPTVKNLSDVQPGPIGAGLYITQPKKTIQTFTRAFVRWRPLRLITKAEGNNPNAENDPPPAQHSLADPPSTNSMCLSETIAG